MWGFTLALTMAAITASSRTHITRIYEVSAPGSPATQSGAVHTDVSRMLPSSNNGYASASCCLFMHMLRQALKPDVPINPDKLRSFNLCAHDTALSMHFTPVCIWFWTWAVDHGCDNLHPSDRIVFEDEIDIYLEETGLQPFDLTYCANCFQSRV